MDIDRDALLPIFIAEAEERLASMEECLVALEVRPHDSELLGELFRAAHTLKGNSASLGFTAVADLLHVLEDLLDRVRHGAVALDRRLVTLLLESVDLLRDRVARVVAGDETPSPRQEALLTALKHETAGSAGAGSGAAATEAPSDDAVVPHPGPSRARGLRIGLEKLDRLLAASGEIAIARGRIGSLLEALGEAGAHVLDAHREAERLDRELHELVMRTRMVPLGPSFRAHLRTVRDVALAQGKQARLVIEGADVEADLAVVEQLRGARPPPASSRSARATRPGSWWSRSRTTGPASTVRASSPARASGASSRKDRRRVRARSTSSSSGRASPRPRW